MPHDNNLEERNQERIPATCRDGSAVVISMQHGYNHLPRHRLGDHQQCRPTDGGGGCSAMTTGSAGPQTAVGGAMPPPPRVRRVRWRGCTLHHRLRFVGCRCRLSRRWWLSPSGIAAAEPSKQVAGVSPLFGTSTSRSKVHSGRWRRRRRRGGAGSRARGATGGHWLCAVRAPAIGCGRAGGSGCALPPGAGAPDDAKCMLTPTIQQRQFPASRANCSAGN